MHVIRTSLGYFPLGFRYKTQEALTKRLMVQSGLRSSEHGHQPRNHSVANLIIYRFILHQTILCLRIVFRVIQVVRVILSELTKLNSDFYNCYPNL